MTTRRDLLGTGLRAAAEGLIRRKYSDEQILGILGGNFAGALKVIWG